MERRALGRGLASLISAKPEEEIPPIAKKEEGGVVLVPIDKIRPNPEQPRKNFDGKGIQELAASIREKGVIVPLICSKRDGAFELISGERRLRAARIAGLREVPVILRDSLERPASERLEVALIENIQREDLNPIEEAEAYRMLIENFGHTQDQVADRVGKERSTVANLLRLLNLPSKIREALQSGQISMGHARALLGVAEIERQLYFLEKLISEGWSVRELETRIRSRSILGKSGLRRVKPLPSNIIQILDDMRRRLGTQVRLIPTSKRGEVSGTQGKILIDYYSEDDLDRIHRLIVHP